VVMNETADARGSRSASVDFCSSSVTITSETAVPRDGDEPGDLVRPPSGRSG
jgi:hypothetical protein